MDISSVGTCGSDTFLLQPCSNPDTITFNTPRPSPGTVRADQFLSNHFKTNFKKQVKSGGGGEVVKRLCLYPFPHFAQAPHPPTTLPITTPAITALSWFNRNTSVTPAPPFLCSPTQYSPAKKSLSVGAKPNWGPTENHIITNHNKALSCAPLPEAQLHPSLLQLQPFTPSLAAPLAFLPHSFLSLSQQPLPSSPSSCPCCKSHPRGLSEKGTGGVGGSLFLFNNVPNDQKLSNCPCPTHPSQIISWNELD